MTITSPEVVARFWGYVEKRPSDECWEWTGTIDTHGYGHMRIGGRRLRLAHRLSYLINHGEFDQSLHVLHRCDNRKCVNPTHLFLGSNAENMADMVAKGRAAHRQGQDNPRARLTASDIRAIRTDERPERAIAKEYGVSHGHINNIKSRRVWGSVK